MLKKLQSEKWIKILLFFGTFIVYIFSINEFASSNETSHFALIQSIVHNQSFIINEFADQTLYVDIAYYNGNYYSDKAPGLSFIGIPIYLICYSLGLPLGMTHFFLSSISAFFTSLTIITIYEICAYLEYSSRTRVLVALVYAFGTIACVYAKTFFAHSTSAFLILYSAFMTMKAVQASKHYWNYTFIGMLLGSSILIEYLNIVLLIPFLIYFLSYKEYKAIMISLLPVALCLGLLGIYNFICFDNPFVLSYSYHVDEPFYAEGKAFLFPIHLGLYYQLVSPIRGLFFHSPILFLGVIGYYDLYKKRKKETLFFALSFLLFVFLFSSYVIWWGGYCYGPRYLLPVITFLSIPSGLYIEKYWKNKVFILGYSLLFLYSIIANALGAFVNPFPPFAYDVIPLVYNASHLINKGRLDSKLLLLSGLDPKLLFGLAICSIISYIVFMYQMSIKHSILTIASVEK